MSAENHVSITDLRKPRNRVPPIWLNNEPLEQSFQNVALENGDVIALGQSLQTSCTFTISLRSAVVEEESSSTDSELESDPTNEHFTTTQTTTPTTIARGIPHSYRGETVQGKTLLRRKKRLKYQKQQQQQRKQDSHFGEEEFFENSKTPITNVSESSVSTSPNIFDLLPEEILGIICSYVSPRDILRLSSCSRKAKMVCPNVS